ncbi:MAG: DNA polymerase III subunit gamma/tau [Pirellula sp.]
MAKKATSQSESVSVSSEPAPETSGKYTVVARRYRPKTFSELVGQSTVAQALLSAIHSNRVGHAYLFTGARGVGKTSTARIFAKALNASAVANGDFDPNSEIALAIDAGEDMDVLEIDGASNRGIDEIRQLRANAAVRPSRARYKIYIIDEVHMLTTQAFNALLKTLEEPPGHVKFIFCTTDPEKIPITVLSRCQRFDFPPVHTEEIFERLKFICKNEGTKADEAALRLLARRAAGSMRDSQSLLEQLLSFGGDTITVESVHAMLGTADETRLAAFAARLIERDAAGALRELDSAASQGVDVGQLAEQLLGYLRDMMTVSVGGGADLVRTASTQSVEQLAEWGKTWGTMTLLSALQLLDETIVKMRYSVQSRVLLEIALVQICNLQDLQLLSDLVKAFAQGQQAPLPKPNLPTVAPSVESKKKVELEPHAEPIRDGSTAHNAISSSTLDASTPSATGAPAPTAVVSPAPSLEQHESQLDSKAEIMVLASAPVESPDTPASLEESSPSVPFDSQPQPAQLVSEPRDNLGLFVETAERLGGFAKQCAELAVRVDVPNESQWKICLSRDGGVLKDYFQTGDNSKRLTQAIQQRLKQNVMLVFELTDEASPFRSISQTESGPSVSPEPADTSNVRVVPQSILIRSAMNDPLVKKFMDMFDGQIVRVDAASTAIGNAVPASVKPHFDGANQASSPAVSSLSKD